MGLQLANIQTLCLTRDTLLRMCASAAFGGEAVGFFVRLRPEFGAVVAPGGVIMTMTAGGGGGGYRLAVVTQAAVVGALKGANYSSVKLTVSTGEGGGVPGMEHGRVLGVP